MLKRLLTVTAALLVSEAGAWASYPAPRLDFSPGELALAEAAAADPDLAAFYGARGLVPAFTGAGAAPLRAALAAAVRTAPRNGLPLKRYRPDRLDALADARAGDLKAELEIARTAALWLREVSGGMIRAGSVDPGIKRPNAGVDLPALLAEAAASADPAAVLARAVPSDPRYLALQRALERTRGMVAPPGTPHVPRGTWRAGTSGPAVAALRARLSALGFTAAPAGDPATFDAPLAEAVAAFQTAAGLPPDGVAGPRTLERLNADQAPGARAVVMAMERFRWLPDDLGGRYVWVNLPEFRARVMEGTASVFDTKVVIGSDTPDRRTPEFSDVMEYVVANPRWVVPRSITVKEYLPRLRKNPNAAAHLDIFDRRGRRVSRSSIDFSKYSEANFPYRMQQKPSDDNALGIVKFIFPNAWNIYLHDTPSKGLFANGTRAFSHGCIRVARPVELAHELLRPQTRDPEAAFSAALKGGAERFLHLDAPLPVHLVYFTTWPGQDGKLQHFGDIYGRDAALWAAWVRALEAPSPLDPPGLATVAASE